MKTRIPKDKIQQWINALRSGEYKQGSGGLQSEEGYCCLGVACDLFIPKSKQQKTVQDGYTRLIGGFPEGQIYSPEWLIRISDDFLDKLGVGLAHLNDGYSGTHYKSYSFKEISDLLQAVYILKVLD